MRFRFVMLCLLFGCACARAGTCAEPALNKELASWGDDHVGKPVPEYVTGDECLFCHRTIGPNWGTNPHQRSLRRATPSSPPIKALAATSESLAREVNLLLGGSQATRFLKRSREYGKLSLLSTVLAANAEALPPATAHWDDGQFADRCAGCHTTAVDPATKRFAALSLDCFVCHGDVPLTHTKDTRLVMLSSTRREAKAVVSVCGQCHLRGGRSASTGRPYPTNFVAGDNLFRDFQLDLRDEALRKLPPQERHIFQNARDAGRGQSTLSCLDCHTVHRQDEKQHQELPAQRLCATCHVDEEGSDLLPSYRLLRSTLQATCGYFTKGTP